MDSLVGMKVVVRVAHRNGFAAAGRDLGMSASAVTKHVAAVEERVGARLFDRTTRSVRTTDAGRVYVERAVVCLQAAEDADAAMRELAKAPRGRLRVTAPTDLQHVLPSAVARFLRAHPALTIDLQLTNRQVDLVEDGIDVALRLGSPSLAGDFVARPLAPVHLAALAAPSFLAGRAIRRPGDLARCPSLIFAEPAPRVSWTFERARRSVAVTLTPALSSNNGTALLLAAAEGAGVVIAPSFIAQPYVASGAVVPILTEWAIVPRFRLYALYAARRFLSPNIRVFVELLHDTLGSTDRFWPL